jgi:hypothetical protein
MKVRLPRVTFFFSDRMSSPNFNRSLTTTKALSTHHLKKERYPCLIALAPLSFNLPSLTTWLLWSAVMKTRIGEYVTTSGFKIFSELDRRPCPSMHRRVCYRTTF